MSGMGMASANGPLHQVRMKKSSARDILRQEIEDLQRVLESKLKALEELDRAETAATGQPVVTYRYANMPENGAMGEQFSLLAGRGDQAGDVGILICEAEPHLENDFHLTQRDRLFDGPGDHLESEIHLLFLCLADIDGVDAVDDVDAIGAESAGCCCSAGAVSITLNFPSPIGSARVPSPRLISARAASMGKGPRISPW